MIDCRTCKQPYDSALRACPSCGFAPLRVSGMDAWAPALMNEGGGFKAEYFETLAQLEANNFWFRGRNAFIVYALTTYFPRMARYMEIGCGTGFVLSGVARAFPEARLCGSEIFCAGLEFAQRRVPDACFMQMDARDIPFTNEFDVIGAYDVLEHIPEDEKVLAEIHRALVPGGGLLLTVPQHPWLWSEADTYACHVRRYTADELHQKVTQAGFEIVRSTSFVSLLLPAMLAARRKTRGSTEFDPQKELRLPKWLDKIFEATLRTELALTKAKLSLPVGGSRLLIARKINH